MKRYMPTFVQRAGETEQWYGMKEDADGDWYSRADADARIDELIGALQDCVFILLKQREAMSQWKATGDTAIEQAHKALRVTG
jgi:hypothetical protein